MRRNIHKSTIYKNLCETAYTIQKKDLVSAAKVMSSAFSDDPSIRYLLGGEKENTFDWQYFLCVLKAIYGKCIMISADNKIKNLLILFPPQLKVVPTIPFLLNGGIRLCCSFDISLFMRSINYENNCKAVKSRYVNPNTWYCMCFVVTPEMQRQGVGSRLIRPALRVLESNHISLYLETHKTVNVDIYKHLGFETADISKIPGTDITQYAMFRK